MVGWGGVQWGPVGIGYVRPDQFLDHLTVIKMLTKYEMFKIIKDIKEPMEQRYSKKRATA